MLTVALICEPFRWHPQCRCRIVFPSPIRLKNCKKTAVTAQTRTGRAMQVHYQFTNDDAEGLGLRPGHTLLSLLCEF